MNRPHRPLGRRVLVVVVVVVAALIVLAAFLGAVEDALNGPG